MILSSIFIINRQTNKMFDLIKYVVRTIVTEVKEDIQIMKYIV